MRGLRDALAEVNARARLTLARAHCAPLSNR